MRFSVKIFLAVFISIFILGSLLIWTANVYVERRFEQEFFSRYSIFTSILSNALTRLDQNTEMHMLNAARVVADLDARKGILSEEELKELAAKLNVTHIFVIDNTGKFIRSTNEPAHLIPNLFSFSPEYRKLLEGKSQFESTPIIQPKPEPKPYKFLSIANEKKNRIIEVAVRVDFIAKTLAQAAVTDKNVLALSLYDPEGTPFGKFSENQVEFGQQKELLPKTFQPTETTKDVQFYTRVESSHPDCSECNVSGTSKHGQYYYVLKASVSKAELAGLRKGLRTSSLLLGLVNLGIAFLLSRIISRRLVKNIEEAVKRVRAIKAKGLSDRVRLKGKDEVAFLTGEFDNLLDSLEASQLKILEAEKQQVQAEAAKAIASQVAHDIRAPLSALQVAVATGSPEQASRNLIMGATYRIKDIAEELLISYASIDAGASEHFSALKAVSQVIEEKKLLSNSAKFEIIDKKDFVIVGNKSHFQRAVSNFVNNSVEARGDVQLTVTLTVDDGFVKIADNGKGMSPADLESLRSGTNQSSKSFGYGLGFKGSVALLEKMGLHVTIESAESQGTTVLISKLMN